MQNSLRNQNFDMRLPWQVKPVLSDPSANTQKLTSAAEVPPARFFGLTVHKQQITYCILDRDEVTLREGEIVLTRERLAQFASKVLQPSDHAALESSTNCWAVVEVLQQYVANVVVSNLMATKAIAHSKINRRSWRKGPASPRGELVGAG